MRKVKSGFLLTMIMVLMVSTLMPSFISAATLERFETIFPGKIPAQQAPNAVVIDGNTQIPSDYQFMMKTTEATKVSLFGTIKGAETYKTTLAAYPDGMTSVPENIVTAIPLEGNANGSYGAIYENVGVYNGSPVNVKMTIVDYTPWVEKGNVYRPHVYIHSKQMGINVGGADLRVRYEFLDANTGKLLNVKGIFSMADIDAYQGVEIFNNPTNPQKIYVTANSNIKYSPTANGFGLFSDSFNLNGEVYSENPNHIATLLFNSNSIELKYYQDRFATNYTPPLRAINTFQLNGKTFNPGDSVSWDQAAAWQQQNQTGNADEMFLYVGQGYSDINIGASYFEVSPYKPVRTAIEKPTKTILDANKGDVLENTLQQYNEMITYKVSHFVPAEYAGQVYQNYVFSDDLEDIFEIKDVRVTNEVGTDVTSYFQIVKDDKTSKVTATALAAVLKQANLPISTFYNHTYTFEIDVQIKEGANLDKYMQDDNETAIIPNKASVTVDGVDYESNTVQTKYNVSEKDIARISKKVNDQDIYTLSSKDETFKYSLTATIPTTVQADGYVITDKLEDVLEYVGNPQVTLTKDADTAKVNAQLQHNNGTITLTLTSEQLAKFANGNVNISFDAKIKEDANLDDYTTDGLVTIPNKATIKTNNKTIESNEVIIQKSISHKQVNGQEHVDLTSRTQQFNYEIQTTVPSGVETFTVTDTLEEALTFVDTNNIFTSIKDAKVDVQGQTLTVTLSKKVAEANANKPLYISFFAEFKENANLSIYPDGKVPNEATVTVNGQAEKTNTVTVSSSLTKLVNGQETANLQSIEDEFTYTIDAKMPNNPETVVISDTLENVLEVTDVNLYNVTDTTDVTNVVPAVKGQTVTATFTEKQVQELANKTIQLQIKAKIKKGEDLTGYEEADGHIRIPNVGTLKVGTNTPLESNEVYVIPVYENVSADIKKSIVEKGQLVERKEVKSKDEAIKYQIDYKLPDNKEITKLVLEDDLEDVLELNNAKVVSEGTDITQLGQLFVDKETEEFTWVMNEQEIKNYYGKVITVEIDATMKAQVSLEKYVALDGKTIEVPNFATMKINDEKALESNKVYVTPTYEKIATQVKKAIVDGNQLVEKKEVKSKDEAIKYQINYTLPDNKEITTLTLKDNLEDVLDLTTVKVTANGQDITKLGNLYLNHDAEEFTWVMNTQEIKNYYGKTITVEVESKFKATANFDKYVTADKTAIEVPNVAQIVMNDETPINSNTVYVSPKYQDINAQVKKSIVDGNQLVEKKEVKSKDEAIKYQINYTLPDNKEITTLTLKDNLEDVLDLTTVKVTANGQDITKLGNLYLNHDAEEFTWVMNTQEIKNYYGKTITVEVESKFKATANFDKYVTADKTAIEVPNVAQIIMNNETPINSNTVHVVPKYEGISSQVQKYIVDNGKLLVNKQLEALKGNVDYRIDYTIPDNKDLTNLILKDDLENVLDVQKVTVMSNDTDITNLGTLNIDHNTEEVIWVMNTQEISKFYGQTITLNITASIKENMSLNDYLSTDGMTIKIPNVGQMQMNNETPIVSNQVNLELTNEDELKVQKYIEDNGKLVERKEMQTLQGDVNYRIDYTIPSNEAVTSILLEDDLEDVLDVKDAIVMIANEEITHYGELYIDHEKEEIVWKIRSEKIKEVVGKVISLNVKASIKDNADFTPYLSTDGMTTEIPNIGEISLNNEKPVKSNEVVITSKINNPSPNPVNQVPPTPTDDIPSNDTDVSKGTTSKIANNDKVLPQTSESKNWLVYVGLALIVGTLTWVYISKRRKAEEN